MLTPKLAGNTTYECRFSYGQYFTEKTIIAKPLDSELNLDSAKINVIGPTKDNFTQPLSIQEILDELEISKDDYYKALSVSKDGDLELHLK